MLPKLQGARAWNKVTQSQRHFQSKPPKMYLKRPIDFFKAAQSAGCWYPVSTAPLLSSDVSKNKSSHTNTWQDKFWTGKKQWQQVAVSILCAHMWLLGASSPIYGSGILNGRSASELRSSLHYAALSCYMVMWSYQNFAKLKLFCPI